MTDWRTPAQGVGTRQYCFLIDLPSNRKREIAYFTCYG